MLKKILLENGLEENKVEEILSSLKENKIYISKNENIDERYSKLKKIRADLEQDLKSLREKNLELENSFNSLKESESLLSEKNLKYEERIKDIIVKNSIEKWLYKNNAKYSDLLLSKFDREKLCINEKGEVENLEEQGQLLKEQFSDLFIKQRQGNTPNNPLNKVNIGIDSEEFEKMGYMDRVKMFEENPELYKALNERS